MKAELVALRDETSSLRVQLERRIKRRREGDVRVNDMAEMIKNCHEWQKEELLHKFDLLINSCNKIYF